MYNSAKIQAGDRVRYLSHGGKPEGEVTEVSFMEDTFTVEWDDKSLIPPKSSYPIQTLYRGHFLILHQGAAPKPNIKCDCGVDIYGSGKHSDWCLKYEKDTTT